MIFITQCDSPAFWQTYLSDPASITMEGILIFNKHLLFLLTAIVLFYTIYYFIEYSNKSIFNPNTSFDDIKDYIKNICVSPKLESLGAEHQRLNLDADILLIVARGIEPSSDGDY